MSTLFGLMSSSASSLTTHTASSATASHNLQNAMTPGYARQRDEIGAAPADFLMGAFIGRGAQFLGVSQLRDAFLEAQVPGALSSSARYAAEADRLESVSALDPESGLSGSIDAFFSALRELTQNPSEPSLRTAVVAAGQRMSLAFKNTAAELNGARSAVDDSIRGSVDEVNGLASQMASLNARIRTASASGAPPNDLLDERIRIRDRLAELTGANVVRDGDGSLHMVLSDGTALVQGDRAARLGAAANATNAGLSDVTLTLPDGTGPRPVAVTALGGSMRGQLDARDGAMKTALQSVDTLAFDLASQLNAVHAAGYGLDGSTGRPLFDVGTSAAGAASRVMVSAGVASNANALATSDASGVPGSAVNAQRLVDVERAPLSGGAPALDALRTAASVFGESARMARATGQNEAVALTHIESLRQSVSGVSIDEEVMRLQRAQRAYEAVLRVINAGNEMLGTLMDLR